MAEHDQSEARVGRSSITAESATRTHVQCDGKGCSDCGGTGQRTTTYIDAGDGVTARVHGDQPLDAEGQEAVAAVVRAAHKMLDRPRGRYGKHTAQLDVEDFHRVVVGIPDAATPQIRRPELRAALIEEEAKETVDAIRAGDLAGAIDGMCDLLAVVYGTAAEFGIDLAPFWDEVHRTNMAKAGGPVREDGKRLKPPGWTPPDIAGLLAKVKSGVGDDA